MIGVKQNTRNIGKYRNIPENTGKHLKKHIDKFKILPKILLEHVDLLYFQLFQQVSDV